MKHQPILIFLLSISIILKGCFGHKNSNKPHAIEKQFQICFPKKDTWGNPAPTQKITEKDVSRLLAGAHVLANNACINISNVKVAGKPTVFSWKENGRDIEVNGLIIRVSCEVSAAETCTPSKNAIELFLPEASSFANETHTFPKQLVEFPTNMSSVALSNYWDLPKVWDFAIQLDVFEVKSGV
ncbi:MAG: hypothetical protein ACPGJS_03295 [Flammeovirgaceae bacterium]